MHDFQTIQKHCETVIQDYMYRLTTGENYVLLVIYHVGALENSIHIIFDTSSKKCAIVDPAWEGRLFHTIIDTCGYTLSQIWVTHYHPDHVNAVDELYTLSDAQIFTGTTNQYLTLQSPYTQLKEDEVFTLGSTTVFIYHTPGHSSDSTCFLLSDDIFVGDTLFVYGAGDCTLPSANPEELFESLHKFKTIIPKNVMLRCGHNQGSHLTTTIEEQCAGNPFLLISTEEDFIRYRMDIHDSSRTYPMSAMNKAQVLELLS